MNIFNKKLELTEQEKTYESVINKLISAKETKKQIKLTQTETKCILKNEEKHFTVLVDSVGITIQNTTFSTKDRLRDKVSEYFKKLIIDAINKDTDTTLLEMSEKEGNLISNINNLL